MLSLRAALLSAILLAVTGGHAAHAETNLDRAIKAAAAEDYGKAIAYADTVAGDDSDQSAAQQQLHKDLRASYYRRWMAQQHAALGPVDDAHAEHVFGTLVALKTRLGAEIDTTELDADLAAATLLVNGHVAKLEAAGDYGEAVALLTAIVALSPDKRDELEKLRARAFAKRIAEAEAAASKPGAHLLRLALAARYGTVPLAEIAAAHEAVVDRTRLRTTIVATGDCFGKQSKLASAAEPGPGIPVQLEIQVGACTVDGPTHEDHTDAIKYDHVEVELVPQQHLATAGFICGTQTDSSGNKTKVISYQNVTGCREQNYVLVQDPPERRETHEQRSEDVTHHEVIYTANGELRVHATWPGGETTSSDKAVGRSIEVHYDHARDAATPSDSGHANAEEAQDGLIVDISSRVKHSADAVPAAMVEQAKRRAAQLAATDPLAAEDELVIAALLAQQVSSELEQVSHVGSLELGAGLFDRPYVVPDLAVDLKLYSLTDEERGEGARRRTSKLWNSATFRSMISYTFDLGYARSTQAARDEKGTFVAGINFFLGYPVAGPVIVSTLFDFRGGNGGLAELRMGVGTGINWYGVLISPMAGFGFDKLGTPDEAKQPNAQYNIAFNAELGVRFGLSVPSVGSLDASFARRRRIDTDFAVENRVDLALRIRPIAVMLQYTQLSNSTGDYFGGITLAHEQAQLLEVLLGFGI